MNYNRRSSNVIFSTIWRIATAPLVIAIALVLMVFSITGQAQTFKILHDFTGGEDGRWPESVMSPAIDKAGSLYGTNNGGGYYGDKCPEGCGAAFELAHTPSEWLLVPLHQFQGGNDQNAWASLTIGPDGALYGTTVWPGSVFRLSPGSTPCLTQPCGWIETVLYDFTNSREQQILGSPVTFDPEGNIYLTTNYGGEHVVGAVVKLTPSKGQWSESVIHSFGEGDDGAFPPSGVIIDQAGNLYGVTTNGGGHRGLLGNTCGTVFQLKRSSGGWTENVLHRFTCGNDGGFPVGGLTLDAAGSVYGTTSYGGSPSALAAGTVFRLTPSNKSWNFTVLHRFFDHKQNWLWGPFTGPWSKMAIDTAGNLYGTTTGAGCEQTVCSGIVFKIRSGDWSYSLVYQFTGEDAWAPCGITLGPNGKLYGTTKVGGAYGRGVIFEITP